MYHNFEGVLGWYTYKGQPDPEVEEVKRRVSWFMAKLDISDADMDRPISKRNALTIESLVFKALTDRMILMEKDIRNIKRQL